MNKADLETFTTELNDGFEIPSTLFDTFLNTAQMYWENRRPWVALRAEDTTQTISPSDTFETEKSLPSDFRKWYTRFPIVLTDADGNPMQFLTEVPINMKTAYKDDPSKFYCNYRTGKLYICGRVPQGYTIRQYYIRRATKVSTSDSTSWELDPHDEYTQILGFTIVVYHKLGVDYDVINNKQADANANVARQIYASMEDWDAELQESALNGQDYTNSGGGGYFGADGMSGNVRNLG